MAVAVESSYLQAMARLGPKAGRAAEFTARYVDDPSHPSISLERLTRCASDQVWSGRVSQDLRAIIFRDGPDDYLLYVDHHDPAYAWAERRRFERHPRLGSLQIFVAPETIDVPPPDRATGRTGGETAPVLVPGLLDHHIDDYLVSLGLPQSWLPVVRQVRDHDQLLEVVQDLPGDVAERLVRVGIGELVTPPVPEDGSLSMGKVKESSDRTVSTDPDDLGRLVNAPEAVWIAFLHPTQRRLATGDFNGPAKVTGTAGTGKSVVAMHRARHLARQGKRVLLTSYVTTLCHNIERSLDLLCTPQERSLIEVRTVHQVARELARKAGRLPASVVGDKEIRELVERFVRGVDCPLGGSALVAEWNLVVQAQGINDWEGYRAANRTGRGTPLTAADRKIVWSVLGKVRAHLEAGASTDWQGLCGIARVAVEEGAVEPEWDAVIVDEVQDLSVEGLRLVASLAGNRPNGLMVLGDGGQRIYAHRSSLRSLGIDVRGRSRVLRINYRTTSQIRGFADRVLTAADDLDGDRTRRDDCRSVRSGRYPVCEQFSGFSEQSDWLVGEIRRRLDDGVPAPEIAVIARTGRQLTDLQPALRGAGLSHHMLLPERPPEDIDAVRLVTMHRAKGLEFRTVFVVDVSADKLPNRFAVNQAGDEQDRVEAVEQERQLLYVALTRARDEVLVGWVGEPTAFLEEAITAPEEAAA